MVKVQQHILKGTSGFLEYYKTLFSDETSFTDWLATLEYTNPPVLRFSKANTNKLEQLWKNANLPWKTLEWYAQAVYWPSILPFGTILPGYEEHLFYPMNASSLIPVLALDPQSNETVLDACAAPGGKTLMIADHMQSQKLPLAGELIANDNATQRRFKLQHTIHDYGYDKNIKIIQRPAETLFKTYPNYFDKILLDAPCSSEKHVYTHEKYLKQWSYSRIKSLKQRQIALLSGLFLALKPGGTIVYSTCATTPEENELVIKTILKKKESNIKLLPWVLNCPGESGIDLPTARRIWPTKNGLDPMFIAVLQRVS